MVSDLKTIMAMMDYLFLWVNQNVFKNSYYLKQSSKKDSYFLKERKRSLT